MWSGRKNNRCEFDGLFDWHWPLFNFYFILFHFISLYLMESVGTVVPNRDGKSNLVLGGNKKETDCPPTCLMEE